MGEQTSEKVISNRTKGKWKIKMNQWDSTEYMTVIAETEEGDIKICQEPVEFFAYQSGAFITTNGIKDNLRFIALAGTIADELEKMDLNAEKVLRVLPALMGQVSLIHLAKIEMDKWYKKNEED